MARNHPHATAGQSWDRVVVTDAHSLDSDDGVRAPSQQGCTTTTAVPHGVASHVLVVLIDDGVVDARLASRPTAR